MPVRLALKAPYQPMEIEEYDPDERKLGYLSVEIRATSLNHLDWKRIEANLLIPSFPHVLGMDIAGIVTDADDESPWQIGDRVMSVGAVGWSPGCSYQTHAQIDQQFAIKIPDSMTFEEAATVPFSLFTAACGLYLSLGLAYEDTAASYTVLIWGANGSVGSFAIQLAKLSGYRVIAVTSSPESRRRAIGMGADASFDRKESDLLSKILAAVPNQGSLRYALDCVVSKETLESIAGCMKGSDGVIATAVNYNGSCPNGADGVPISLKAIFSGAALGKRMGPGTDEDGLKLGKWLVKSLPSFFEAKKLRPLDYEVIGNLTRVPGGLERLKKGGLNKKLVVQNQ